MSERPCEVCRSQTFNVLFMKHGHPFEQCRDCLLIRIDPRPTESTLQQIYGHRYYDAWGMPNGARAVRELKVRTFGHLLGQLHLPKHAQILDCGAAFGFLMDVAADMGFEPYGIELSPEAGAEIMQRFGPSRVFIGPFEQAGCSFTPTSGRFHAVCMFDFIEHLTDPLRALKMASEFLVPGGHLVITTPDTGSLSRRLMGTAWLHFKTEHLYYFNRRNLCNFLDQAGFCTATVTRARKTMNMEYVWHQMNTYPQRGLTQAVHVIRGILPRQLRYRSFPVSFGEMLIVARKNR